VAKVKISKNGLYAEFHCPGCDRGHSYIIKLNDLMKELKYPCWKFNNDVDNPTFTPSLLNHRSPTCPRCHLYVKNGKIEFCSDCEHDLKGQTVEMKDIKE